MVLSSCPNETLDFVLMVIAGGFSPNSLIRQLWTKIDKRVGAYADVVHYGGGNFYAFGYPGKVFVFNLSASGNQIEVEGDLIGPILDWRIYDSEVVDGNQIYLLKTTNGSLVLISRSNPLLSSVDRSYISTKFQVYDLDVEKGTWKEIYSLGNMAVFLGHNSTTFVDASRFPGVVKPNHIYFTDDNFEFYYGQLRGLCGGYDSGCV